MANYTPKKVKDTIKSVSEAIVIHHKLTDQYVQLVASLRRVERALNPELDFSEELKEMKTTVTQELEEANKEDPLGSSINAGKIGRITKQRIMKKYNSKEYGAAHDFSGYNERWDDFIIHMERQHERDRARLIKDGDIKV